MFLLLVLSTVLLVLYISSLRFIIKTGKNYVIREEIQKLESHIPDESESGSAVSFSLVFSLVIAVILNLVEIGYFVYCSYFFNDTVITVGSSR
jgi:Ca2+/H+ antiporter